MPPESQVGSSELQDTSDDVLQLLNTHVAILTQHSQSLVTFQQHLFHRDSQLTQQEIELSRLIAQAEQALSSATSLRDAHLATQHRLESANAPQKLNNDTNSKPDLNGARKRPSEDMMEAADMDAKRLRIDAQESSHTTPVMDNGSTVQYGDIVAEVEQRLRARDGKGWKGLQAGPSRLATAKRKRTSGDSLVSNAAETMKEMVVVERTGKRLKSIEHDMQDSGPLESAAQSAFGDSSGTWHPPGNLLSDGTVTGSFRTHPGQDMEPIGLEFVNR